MAEKRKLLQSYMKSLNALQGELKRKELEKTMRELELLQSELARRQDAACGGGGIVNKNRQKEQPQLLESNGDKGRPSESENLPHPPILEEYTIAYCCVDEGARELLEAALAVRSCAYVPLSNSKVGAAFRAKCGTIYTGCNIEPGNCAERCALAKGISEGERKYIAGAVVAYRPEGFTTPCGVCRQFIREFANKDFPIYIAKAPEMEGSIQDTDEVLVTSAYNLLPHSFSTI